MVVRLLSLHSLKAVSRDGWLLFATRFLRMFAYGMLTVILMLYLRKLGFSEFQAGLLFTLTLLGDTAISLWITTTADRIGRRRVLVIGSILMVLSGIGFVLTQNLLLLTIAATVGVISPSGNEVGPFLALEQGALAHLVAGNQRVSVFAWYNVAGFVATGIGALLAGAACRILQSDPYSISALASYRIILLGYSAIGLIMAVLFMMVSRRIEIAATPQAAPNVEKLFLGLHRSRRRIFRLSALFSLDAFATGFVMQTLLAYWFHVRWGANEAVLGSLLFAANILSGISALAAPKIASRFGLLMSMIIPHVPASVFLILVPLMPNLPLAMAMLLLRFSVSKMDVPSRQCYTLSIVDPDERSAAAGISGVARTTGAGLSPIFAGLFLGTGGLISVPFFLAGGLEIAYDFLLWRSFHKLPVPTEEAVPVPHKRHAAQPTRGLQPLRNNHPISTALKPAPGVL